MYMINLVMWYETCVECGMFLFCRLFNVPCTAACLQTLQMMFPYTHAQDEVSRASLVFYE